MAELKLKPMDDRVLVEYVEEESTTESGIIIPDTAKEKPQEGEVTAVGPGKTGDDGKTIAMTVKKGDKVIYGKYSGTEVKLDNEDYLLMREDDILGIIS